MGATFRLLGAQGFLLLAWRLAGRHVYVHNDHLPEDLTLEQIKEQLAIYRRLYYQKRRQDKDFMEKKRANTMRHNRRKNR